MVEPNALRLQLGQTVWVITPTQLVLRQQAMQSAPALGKVDFGTQAVIIGIAPTTDNTSNRWYNIRTADGRTGWVIGSYNDTPFLSTVKPDEPFDVIVRADPRIAKERGLIVRSDARVDASIVDRVQSGERLTVFTTEPLTEGACWYGVHTPRDQYGWILDQGEWLQRADEANATQTVTINATQSAAISKPIEFPGSTGASTAIVPWGKCYAGLAATSALKTGDVEALRASRLEAFRLVVTPAMSELESQLEWLDKTQPELFKLVTLVPSTAKSRRPLKPDDFMEALHGAVQACTAHGIRYFEVSTEPNSDTYGLGWNWRTGREFGDWFVSTVRLLRKAFPQARFGFPGLLGSAGWNRFLEEATDAAQYADWIGVHCLWGRQTAVTDTSGGLFWKLYQERFPNYLLMITEFSNNNPSVDYVAKGEEYGRYFQLLRHAENVGAAFAYASSVPGGDANREAWSIDGRPTPIALTVGNYLTRTDFLEGAPDAHHDVTPTANADPGGSFSIEDVTEPSGGVNIGGDYVAGDKIGGDKIGGDKVEGDKIVIGGNISIVLPSVQYARPPDNRKVTVKVEVNAVTLTCGADRYASPNRVNAVELDAARALSPQKYGELLFAGLFNMETLTGFENPTRVGYNKHLRGEDEVIFELDITPGDVTLNLIKWEYLVDPDNVRGLPFALYEKSPFFRLLGGASADPATEWPLRVLAIICNPVTLGLPLDAEGWPIDAQGVRANRNVARLAALDAAREHTILRDALERMRQYGAVDYRILDRADGPPVTLAALNDALTNFKPHILHVVAHGVTVLERFHLVMENDQQREALVPVTELDQARFSALRLVVLDTCQSANLEVKGTLHGLAPHLIGLGVSAVVAMQDAVPIPTAQRLTQWFYQHLARSGRIDMALAATRLQLHDIDKRSWDWGIPVLFMSSDQGQLFDVSDEQAQTIPAAITPTDRKFAATPDKAQAISRYLAGQAAQLGAPPALVRAYSGWAAQPPSLPLIEAQDRRSLSQTITSLVQINGQDLAAYVNPPDGKGLHLDVAVFERIASALNAGKHIILIGPPGTGKTSLANRICEYAARQAHCAAGVTATTATADWTTFDTVGGYVPTQQQTLEFRPGVFLRAIAEGKWLIIDEINRAEIDKAFGELFTLLSGQRVDLPYTVRGQNVCVRPCERNHPADWIPADVKDSTDDYHFVVHPTWRIIGTMNVYDKSYLFALSFAFMRRFAFIDCDLPGIIDDGAGQRVDLYFKLVQTWIAADFKSKSNDALADKWRDLIQRDTPLMKRRALGPAIIRDMLLFVKDRDAYAANGVSALSLLGEACLLYAVPQLDGLDRDDILDIYTYLAGYFKSAEKDTGLDKVRRNVLERIELLYPHIRPEEWKKARGGDAY